MMQSAPPDDYPISGVCIVADPSQCSPGYELLYKSHDRRDDCDLWKDSFFKSRITRYLCFTRKYPNEGNRANSVLVDIVIQNDKDLPPGGFTLIEHTTDSSEKATRKKQICVKFVPRNSTQDAISEIVILSSSKRALPGYTLAGEVNGLLICFKLGKIPPETQTLAEPSTPATPSHLINAPFSTNASSRQGPPPAPHRTFERQDSANQSLMTGVPFHLNPKYQNYDHMNLDAPEISYRSLIDIENEFTYPFSIERSVEQQFPTL